MPTRIKMDCEELRRLYEEDLLGVVALAQRYRCSATTISNRLRACGIKTRSARFQPIQVSQEKLRHMYEVERLPVKEIAHRLGVSTSTIGNRRRKFGIPVRSRQGQRYRTPGGKR